MPPLAPWTVSEAELTAALAHLVSSDVRADVIIPAKNEATTIGAVLDALSPYRDLLQEVVVVNDHSDDDTAVVAAHHGARVLQLEEGTGKGQAMAAGVAGTTAPFVVFLDADVVSISTNFVPRLLAPFATSRGAALVKGFYVRPLHDMPSGGGRVNELAARPILSLLYPGLGEMRQPLAGETAVRRDVLERCGLADGYSVEIALLLDVAAHFGVAALAQVDLGTRRHRNRPIEELRPMATEILRTALTRYGVSLPTT